MSSFSETFLQETADIVGKIDYDRVERLAAGLADIRAVSGRLFVLGTGGSAAHASHAVSDFRRLCGFEAYAPTDNVAELTARAIDQGWDNVFADWLRRSKLKPGDGVLVLSLGGGDRDHAGTLVRALDAAREASASIFGIVGRDGGYTSRVADECVVIPPLFDDRVVPHTQAMCAVLWQLLVSHPRLRLPHNARETNRR